MMDRDAASIPATGATHMSKDCKEASTRMPSGPNLHFTWDTSHDKPRHSHGADFEKDCGDKKYMATRAISMFRIFVLHAACSIV